MLSHTLFGWLVSLLFSLSSLPTALATGPAGGFERLGPIYEVYRIAVATWGAGQKDILPGLAGKNSHSKGGANWVDVMNHLQDKNYDSNWWLTEADDTTPGVGSVEEPDLYKAAVRMDYNKMTNLVTIDKVFKGADANNWPAALAKSRQLLEKAHSDMKTAGKLDEIARNRDRLAQCHIEIIRHRSSDMVGGTNGKKGMKKDIENRWPGAKVELIEYQWAADEQVTVRSIDIDKTFSGSPAGTFTDVEEVKKFVHEYGTGVPSDTNIAKKHYAVIAEHQATMTTEWRNRTPGASACS